MNNYPIKVIVYVMCYNELAILPFVVDYWRRYATKVVVYDNYSTDGSDRFLSQFDFIEVRRINTKGKFSPSTVANFKNTAWKECRGKGVDFVQVSDLDEVITAPDMMAWLSDVKNSGATMALANYGEVVCDKLPNYTGELLAHEHPGAAVFHQQTIRKPMLFRPDAVSSIKFSDDCRTAQATGNIQYYRRGAETLHLKMFGTTNYIGHNKEIMARCDTRDYAPYGRTEGQMGIIKSNLRSTNPTAARAQESLAKTPRPERFQDVEWTDTSIRRNGAGTGDRRCVIVVPVYKNCASADEINSLRQLVKVLGGKHDICLCCPKGLYTDYYRYICNHEFDVLECNPQYFRGQDTYSWMCETSAWYRCFSEYRHMLLYQPDGWVFYDNLDYFLESDFDYIGGPWKDGYVSKDSRESVGNGGVSLRKVSKFAEALDGFTADYDAYPKKHIDFEDLLFCVSMRDRFWISDIDTAYQFCFDANPTDWWERSGKRLPMFAHAWRKHNYADFWKDTVVPGKTYSNPYLNEVCFKASYMYGGAEHTRPQETPNLPPETIDTPIIVPTVIDGADEPQASIGGTVAICAIAKNENLYIREWAEYHRSIGVEHIFLYDNNEVDGEDFDDSIGDLIDSGFVEVIDVRGEEKGLVYTEDGLNLQPKCYKECYETKGALYKWIAFIDIDEFLHMREGGDIRDYLNDDKFGNVSTILVSWEHYDDNDLVTYDSRPVMERFTRKSSIDRRATKSIVRTGGEITNISEKSAIHCIRVKDGIIAYADGKVDAIKNQVYKTISEPETGRKIMKNFIKVPKEYHDAAPLVLNHYCTKSLEEFIKRQVHRHWGTSKVHTDKPISFNDCIQKFFSYCPVTATKIAFIEQFTKKL